MMLPISQQEKADEVLKTVSELLREVIGEDMDQMPPVTMATAFNRDLQMESIEFVAMAELIQERFGGSVDFIQWISGKELDEIINLTVGELVTFISEAI